MKKTQIMLLLLFLSQYTFSQNEDLFKRLRVIKKEKSAFYNVDGIDFSKENFGKTFNKRNLRKAFARYNVKRKVSKTTDTTLNFKNYKVTKKEKLRGGGTIIRNIYITENKENIIEIYAFNYLNKIKGKNFEYKMIKLIRANKVPKTCYNSLDLSKVNFVGRELKLGVSCRWMGINNVQCPYYGQMNWSLHKTKESADIAVKNQFEMTKSKKGVKLISEEEQTIIFEEAPTKVKKVVFKLKGLNKLLASTLSGGKSLTVYYVSAKVRENFVSCVLSHWDNDVRNPSGLPPLLDSVMRID
ncbi:hypothetical protein [Tenacibaculum sp. 190524A02b]|uniref:Uncharacterized protein n=1 Tax=Tenacibaculum vairaonense TaxID=3137860 RepID=A0ABP1FD88_9FLAO